MSSIVRLPNVLCAYALPTSQASLFTRIIPLQTVRHHAAQSKPTSKPQRPPPAAGYGESPPVKINKPVQSNPLPNSTQYEARDPARGYEASMRVARGEKLDPRYKGASRRVLAIIVAVPFALVLGYELFQRRFLEKRQKTVSREGDEGSARAETH